MDRADRTASIGRETAAIGMARRTGPSRGRTDETAVILNYMDRRRRKASAEAASERLVVEIVEALLFLGGQAHRDLVVGRVAAMRTGTGDAPSDALRAETHAAFESRLMLDRSRPGRPVLFDLPLGDESHRWALAREAATFLRQGREARAAARSET